MECLTKYRDSNFDRNSQNLKKTNQRIKCLTTASSPADKILHITLTDFTAQNDRRKRHRIQRKQEQKDQKDQKDQKERKGQKERKEQKERNVDHFGVNLNGELASDSSEAVGDDDGTERRERKTSDFSKKLQKSYRPQVRLKKNYIVVDRCLL